MRVGNGLGGAYNLLPWRGKDTQIRGIIGGMFVGELAETLDICFLYLAAFLLPL